MKSRRISIVLDRDYSDFVSLQQERFIDELSDIAGAERESLRNVRVRKACVLFTADMDEAAARRLELLFRKHKDGTLDEPEKKEIAAFFSKYNFTFCKTVPAPAAGRPPGPPTTAPRHIVFFVHGLTGDKASFGKLPEFIQDECDCVAVNYEYPSKRFSKSPSIFFIANNLDNFIRNEIRSQHERVALVGHSMGGVILRDMLGRQIFQEKPLDAHVKMATFIASPLNGAWIAKFAKHLPGVEKNQIKDLDPSSPYLTDVTNRWFNWRNKRGGREIKIHSIYGDADNIVDPAVAAGDDPHAIAILGGTHTDIAKPKQKDDEIVKTLRRLIEEAGLGRGGCSQLS